jgi:hypothetical protein
MAGLLRVLTVFPFNFANCKAPVYVLSIKNIQMTQFNTRKLFINYLLLSINQQNSIVLEIEML